MKPIVFLHIPKTAGTSLIMMLRNMFGDNRLLRVENPGLPTPAEIEKFIAVLPPDLGCLVGHIPFHWFAGHLDRFRYFTVLRNPVDRVMSLYRFLHKASTADLQELGLKPGFTFDDFIDSEGAGMISQVSNGMCRMLCRDRRMTDPNDPLFWNRPESPEILEQALETLEKIHFGLVEQMDDTLRLLTHAWNLPYHGNEYHENATEAADSHGDAESVYRIVKCNVLDIALYHRATKLFRSRFETLTTYRPTPDRKVAEFRPVMDTNIPIGDIPGRQGFHEREQADFAWLRAEQAARLSFLPPGRSFRLRLNLYAIVPDYPVAETVVALNGHPLVLQCTPSGDPGWFKLESAPVEAAAEQNLLTIEPPWFLPVRYLDATSKDRRSLALALSSLAFLSAN